MPDEYSLLRHSLRGTINALKLGVSAMDTGLTRDESLEFLDYIIQACDKMNSTLDQYDSLPWPQVESSGAKSQSLTNIQ